MKRKQLTVNETLRFAKHDFLNDLQIISMNLQLGKVDEAKQWIDQISMKLQKQSLLHKLSLPLTTEWLLTVKWRYPEFQFTITNEPMNRISLHEDVDMQIVFYLEETMIQLQKNIDPYEEQMIFIRFKQVEGSLHLQVEAQGKWQAQLQLPRPEPYFIFIEKENSETKYVYELSVAENYVEVVKDSLVLAKDAYMKK